jgi:Domain of unknown function (DUF6946)
MSGLEMQNAAGEPITTLEEWRTRAAPKKGDLHWKDGRSAKECASAWLRSGTPALPGELRELLESRPETSDFFPRVAVPECVTRIDEFAGEHRNHDLIAVGEARGGVTLLAVEAKADEPFGPTVEAQLAAAAGRVGSNIPKRVHQLVQGLFGSAHLSGDVPSAEIGALRYQLLTAAAGALMEAKVRGAEQAVLVVHEFTSRPEPATGYAGTKPQLLAENAAAFDAFLSALGAAVSPGPLRGPFAVPGNGFIPSDVPLYAGKATVRVE